MPFDQQDFQPLSIEPRCNDPVLQILQDARQLLSDPARWCKDALESNGAVCARGALFNARKGYSLSWDGWPSKVHARADRFLAKHIPPAFGGSLPFFNNSDSTTHADVLALFDRAIAACLAEQAKVAP